jgi:hypothetical protein
MPVGKLQEKNMKKNMKKKIVFFASLQSMKKGVGSGSGSARKCHGTPTLLLNILLINLQFKGNDELYLYSPNLTPLTFC